MVRVSIRVKVSKLSGMVRVSVRVRVRVRVSKLSEMVKVSVRVRVRVSKRSGMVRVRVRVRVSKRSGMVWTTAKLFDKCNRCNDSFLSSMASTLNTILMNIDGYCNDSFLSSLASTLNTWKLQTS